MASFVDLDESQAKRLEIDLYQNRNHEATAISGSLKSYGVKEGGSAILDNKRSGYSVTADRLLWVDGWEKTTFEGSKTIRHQEMTLVVLRIDLASRDPKRKFGSANITLAFEGGDGNTSDPKDAPEVQAWAPFNTTERYNASKASHTKSSRTEFAGQAGYSGVELSGSWSSEHGISWDRTNFDQGSSIPVMGQLGRRNGVTWILEQNELQNAGVQQTFYIAVLISRQSREPYLVKFDAETRVGTMEDFKNKTKAFFRSNPEKTKPYLVTPWKQKVCNYEGVDILKCIDLDNLGKLRNRNKNSSLQLKWELSHHVEIEGVSTVKHAEESLGNIQAAEEIRDSFAEEAISASLKPAGGTHTETPLPLSISTADDLAAPPVDLARFTALEACVAQLEARLASQGEMMLRMQQAFA
ncbi:hypothetical protein MKX08_004142 [Trichoderma sp. CBMAI-0020]|nr:hypothetical protein MKX08_004142 [Trichoderma sp. CBMAI-0020]